MDDIRYSELVFLQKLANRSPDFELFRGHADQAKIVGLTPSVYEDMTAALLEDLNVRFCDQDKRMLVARLRGELSLDYPRPRDFHEYQWANPRETIYEVLRGQLVYRLEITYRGLRRIEELRDLLRRDRILERFGVLLDWRYLHNELRDALRRSPDISVSVLYADLDKFKQVNDQHGHDAGDVVLKAYLEIVRDVLGSFGTAFRGTGDEVAAIIVGQTHERAVQLAEQIRASVETMKCKYKDKLLPGVTASIGVATTPPESRTVEIESVSESRNREAKTSGKNCVIGVPQKKRRANPA